MKLWNVLSVIGAFKMKLAFVSYSSIDVIATITIERSLGAIYYITTLTSCDSIWKAVCQLHSGLECDENLGHLFLPDRGVTWEALYKQGDSMSGSEVRSKQESQQRPRSPSTQTAASLADKTSSQSAFSTDLKHSNCHNQSLPSYCQAFKHCIAIVWFSRVSSMLLNSIFHYKVDTRLFASKNAVPEETI